MSFLLDPPLLVVLGIISVLLGKTPRGRKRFAVFFVTIVFSISLLLYLDVIPWPWFTGWVKGSDFMLNSGLGTGLERSRGTDVLAVVLFGAYPLWLWLGMEMGERIRGHGGTGPGRGKGREANPLRSHGKTRVVVTKTEEEDDSDRFSALDEALGKAGFWDRLQEVMTASGKGREDFSIAVKPNLMMYYSGKDMSVITDPALVEHLIERMRERGYTNIALVESQNVFGNWFRNRDVATVARVAGYSGSGYRIVDITEEKIPHTYPGRLGDYYASPTWRDADFRISFAKNKTHFSCYFTLCLKNIYGTTPEQNKFLQYHKKREVDWVTIEMLKEFPVHFGIIDGVWSADGLLGIKADFTPKHTRTIIAGENIIAVDMVGGRKMGLDPMESSFVSLAVEEFGMPDFDVDGDDSVYDDWDNVPLYINHIFNIGEEFYKFSNFFGFVSSDMDPAFPLKEGRSRIDLAMRQVVLKILRLISKYE